MRPPEVRAQRVGQLAERYDVAGAAHLGAGSFSSVFRASARDTGVFCAVKVLKPQARQQVGDASEAEHEARVLAAVHHACCVRLVECLIDDANTYIVMELAEGVELLQYVTDRGPLPEVTAQLIAGQLASVLHHLHIEASIVHGDLKPENILISPGNGRIKVIDFGCAITDVAIDSPATTKVRISGTLFYAAPEVLEHMTIAGNYPMRLRQQDIHLLDVFAFGVCMYLCLEGRLPFAPPDYPHEERALLPRVECLLEFIEEEYPRLFRPRSPSDAGHDRHAGAADASPPRRAPPCGAVAPVSDEGQAFVRNCLQPCPSRRLRTPALAGQSWLVGQTSSWRGARETDNGEEENEGDRVGTATVVPCTARTSPSHTTAAPPAAAFGGGDAPSPRLRLDAHAPPANTRIRASSDTSTEVHDLTSSETAQPPTPDDAIMAGTMPAMRLLG